MEAIKRPWTIAGYHIDRGNIQIGSPEDYIGEVYGHDKEAEANAELIVRAVNSFDNMVVVLGIAELYISKMVEDNGQTVAPPALTLIKHALKQAEREV